MATSLLVPRDTVRFTDVITLGAPESYHLAVKVNFRLNKTTAEQLADIVRYAWRAWFRAESLGDYVQHGHNTIVFWSADSTKSVRDDLGEAWFDFLEALEEMVVEGTPVRKTNRTGPKGTRAVEGFGAGTVVTVLAES